MIYRRSILIAGAAVLLIVPALLAWLPGLPAIPASAVVRLPPATPSPLPTRTLFATDTIDAENARFSGAPRLVGIVGRVPLDAVALLEGEDGPVRSLAIGGTIDGWQVREIGKDRVRLVRNGRDHVAILPSTADPQ